MLNCTSSDDVTVLSTTIPTAYFSTNQVKQTVQFFGATYLNAKYFWSFGDGAGDHRIVECATQL